MQLRRDSKKNCAFSLERTRDITCMQEELGGRGAGVLFLEQRQDCLEILSMDAECISPFAFSRDNVLSAFHHESRVVSLDGPMSAVVDDA